MKRERQTCEERERSTCEATVIFSRPKVFGLEESRNNYCFIFYDFRNGFCICEEMVVFLWFFRVGEALQ